MDVDRRAAARAWRLLVCGLGVAGLVAGCGGGDPAAPAVGRTAEPASTGPTSTDVFTACSPPGIVDYDPIESLAVLAGDSSVVITGEIDRIQAGRDTTYSSPNETSTSGSAVIVVREVRVVTGELEPTLDKSVYIEFASNSPEECGGAVPPGTAIVAYLEPAWDGTRDYVDEYVDPTSVYTEIEHPDAGRPVGQSLYQVAALEGLIWQIPGSAEVIWPLHLGTGLGSISDALPDGTLAGPE